MAVTFKGELTKHIQKCYPSGKAHEKKPVPNELSMLIFYLQTRPAKIPKAAYMLSTKAHHYSTKENTGNLTVTALIMQEIVTNTHDHFSLFAEGALEILELLIDRSHGNDTELLGLAGSLFAEFNQYHTGVLFSGNTAYSNRFLAVIQKLAKLATTGSPVSRVITIKALTSLACSPALATKTGQKGLLVSVKAFEANISKDKDVYAAVSDATSDGETHFKNNDLGFNAVLGLREYLNTSSLDQIGSILNNVLQWLVSDSGDWQPALVAYMARWVPPQNRYLVTKSVVATMASLPPERVREAGLYCTYLEALLTGDESKIGLSVVEVLRQLLKVQHRLIQSPAESVDTQSIQDLIVRLRRNIGYLADTRVYPGQTSDMLAEVLSKYALAATPVSTLNSKADASSNESIAASAENVSSSFTYPRPLGIIINDFRVLMEIQNSSPTDQRKLNLSLWEGTQWLLTSQHPQLLALYATTFSKFLEAAQPSAHLSSRRGSVITRQLCDCARHELAPINYVAIYYCLVSLTKFQSSSCQYLLPWILTILPERNAKFVFVQEESSDSDICRESVGLATLLAVFRTLNQETIASELFSLITERVKKRRWLPGITYPPAVSVEAAVSSLVNGTKLSFAEEDESLREANAGGSAVLKTVTPLIESSDLPAEDIDFILHPPFSLDAQAETDDVRSVQVNGSSSISETSAKRSVSTVSQSSVESNAPRVEDLRKWQEDVRSLSTMKSSALPNREKKISLPTKRNSQSTIKYSDADILSILEKIPVDGNQTAKGNLTT